MLEKELVNQKLEDHFGENYISEVSISSTESKSLILVETKTDFALVTVKDFTHLPIGDIDLFIEKRVTKTDNPLYDMADMIRFLQMDTDKNLKQLQDKVLEITGELVDVSKSFSKTSVLATHNK